MEHFAHWCVLEGSNEGDYLQGAVPDESLKGWWSLCDDMAMMVLVTFSNSFGFCCAVLNLLPRLSYESVQDLFGDTTLCSSSHWLLKYSFD